MPISPPPPREAQTYADFLVGRMANLTDDHSAAADRYFAALERAPRDEALIEGALSASMALGDVERARRAARMAPEQSAPATAHLVRAADALRQANWRRANTELDRTEGAAAEELLARMMQLWANVGRERLDAALLHLEPLATVRPYGGLFAYQQAMALDVAGRNDEALAAYQLGAQSGLMLPAGAIRHAELLARLQRRDEALGVLRAASAASSDPSLPVALARMEAGGPSMDALTPAQGAAIGVYGMGAIFAQEHDTDSALLALSLAQMLDPDFAMATLLFAETQIDLGRHDIAASALTRVSSDSPYYNNARLLHAWLLLDVGEQDEAVTIARAAAETGDPRARRALADMYTKLDNYAEAEPIYSALIAADDDNWRLYFSRGAARERTGRWQEAEVDLRRALELAPQQPEVLNYLGYSWIDRGENVQEGMALIERAVALRPDSGAILDSLGWGYYRLHDYARAVQYLERAVELEPADPTLNDHLGDVYWRLGRRIEARFQWRRALTLSPDDAAPIQAKLEHGLPRR
jgi:tetratricopeptide (TPR) repeat protein